MKNVLITPAETFSLLLQEDTGAKLFAPSWSYVWDMKGQMI